MTLAPGALATLVLACVACAASRDVVPESHDVEGIAKTTVGGYEYIAKRPLGVVAVAESRGLAPDVVKSVADRLADALDLCATGLAKQGRLVPAAARVAAHVERDGSPVGLALTLSPGAGPTANALLCFVSPFKLVRFPVSDVPPETRGVALEASWGARLPTTSGDIGPRTTP